MNSLRVAHLTSAHPRYDTRIFLKQCSSLSRAGHSVTLIVADGKGDETRNGVKILDAGRVRGRISRMTMATKRVVKLALRERADIYHLHDPELLTVALRLKKAGKRVFFDSHEDVPQDILTKPYLSKWVRPALSASVDLFQSTICRRLDGVVAATPFIAKTFAERGIRCVDVNNYPILDEFKPETSDWAQRKTVCYIGALSRIRGIPEMVEAAALTDTNTDLTLGGRIEGTDVERLLPTVRGWDRVNALGQLDRGQVRSVLSNAIAGLVLFQPGPNHLDSQPNKMFEYMSAGIPVIASNFPLWREIIEGNDCGITVDPRDLNAIAAAIDSLVRNPSRAQTMGQNGREAVERYYNWQPEFDKLIAFYSSAVNRS